MNALRGCASVSRVSPRVGASGFARVRPSRLADLARQLSHGPARQCLCVGFARVGFATAGVFE